jgi:hypothetical protein
VKILGVLHSERDVYSEMTCIAKETCTEISRGKPIGNLHARAPTLQRIFVGDDR